MASRNPKRNIVVIVDNQFNLFDFSCCIEVFLVCNSIEDRYRFVYSSPNGGTVYSRAGFSVSTESLGVVVPGAGDIVVIIGGADGPRPLHPTVSDWLRTRASLCRLCGIGAGVNTLLQSLGFDASQMEGQYSDRSGTSREEQQPVARRVGSSWICRGKTAALDLMLALVAEDLGRPHALRVAEELLMYVWRPPDEPLTSVMLGLQKRGNVRFPSLHDYIRTNLSEDLRVERLAELCGMTPRTFARLYRQEMGKTPAAAVRSIRLEAARKLIEGQALSLSQISDLTGFGSELSLRRAFLRAFGKPPAAARH